MKWTGEVPWDIPEELRGSCTRSVVKDTATCQTRWEMKQYVERPMLALNIDEGSKGFAANWFLFSHLKCRGAWLRGPFHRMWRDWQLSIADVGWTSTVDEGLVLLNFRLHHG